MSKKIVIAAFLVALAAACAKKEETVYTEPVTPEPVYTGKI